MKRRYTFKLYPSAEQHEELIRQCHMVGDLWNAMLAQIELAGEGIYRPLVQCFGGPPLIEGESREARRERLDAERKAQRGRQKRARETGTNLTWNARGKKNVEGKVSGANELTQLYAARPEWRRLSTWTGRMTCDALGEAFKAFFRRAKQGAGASSGYPKFRPYSKQNWLPHCCKSGCKIEHVRGNTWRMQLKGVDGWLHMRGKLPAEPEKFLQAGLRYDDVTRTWWLSVAVGMPARRAPGDRAVTVEFDGIDRFASVDGASVFGFELGIREDAEIAALQRRMSELEREAPEYARMRERKARLQAKQRRRRRERLHEWTTDIVRRANELSVTVPEAIRENTASGKGDECEWGAAVAQKAEFNKHVLSQAPAAAAAMLKYKAAEAGIPHTETQRPNLVGGNIMVANRKAARKLKHALKELRNE